MPRSTAPPGSTPITHTMMDSNLGRRPRIFDDTGGHDTHDDLANLTGSAGGIAFSGSHITASA